MTINKNFLLIGGGIVMVTLILVLVLTLDKKNKEKNKENKEHYGEPCSKCQSYGRKTCVNRDLFNDLYRAGLLTENSIPQNDQANWTEPVGDAFYTYTKDAGTKQCGNGW